MAFEREADLLAAALHGVAARVLAEDERRLRHADFFRPHDFVGPAILQHAVLVNPGLVRERVAADDGLVRLNRFAGQRGQHLARGIDLAGLDAGGVRQPIRADARRHDDFLERRIAGALADAVDRALDLTGAGAAPPPACWRPRDPRSSWQWALKVACPAFGTRLSTVSKNAPISSGVE